MSKSRNLVDLNPDAGGLLPSSNMAAGAAVSNIGYTPVNNAGGTMTGALTATGFTGPLTGNAATATNVAYSGLTGTVPTWNQSTTGNAATATNVAYSGLTGTVPTWNQSTTGNAATATTTTGNAATATALATGRTIALTGDVTYTSPSFTGAANVTAAATLAASGVTAGTYGSASAIPAITIDAKGRVTSATTNALASSAPTTAQVLAAEAGASVGAVGTYACLLSSSNVTTGGTIAGSNSRYANGGSNYGNAYNRVGGTPSGTWRCMGYPFWESACGVTFSYPTLFLRIS